MGYSVPRLFLDHARKLEWSYNIGSVVHPFVCPSVCPDVFLGLDYQFFLNFGKVLQVRMKLSMTARFFGIQILFALKFCNENLHYLPRTSSNLIFEKNLVPEIGARMLSANQIAGFLNPTIYSEKMMKQPFFCIQILKVKNLKVD